MTFFNDMKSIMLFFLLFLLINDIIKLGLGDLMVKNFSDNKKNSNRKQFITKRAS